MNEYAAQLFSNNESIEEGMFVFECDKTINTKISTLSNQNVAINLIVIHKGFNNIHGNVNPNQDTQDDLNYLKATQKFQDLLKN